MIATGRSSALMKRLSKFLVPTAIEIINRNPDIIPKPSRKPKYARVSIKNILERREKVIQHIEKIVIESKAKIKWRRKVSDLSPYKIR